MKKTRADIARINKLNAKLVKLRNEISDIEQPYADQAANDLLGKCFKVRNNYSCPQEPSDYWWLYVRVVRADSGSVHCLRFEVDKNENVRVQTDEFYMPRTLEGYQLIDREEFDAAYTAMLAFLKKQGAL